MRIDAIPNFIKKLKTVETIVIFPKLPVRFNSFFLGILPLEIFYNVNSILIIEIINITYRIFAAIKFYEEKIIKTIIKQITSYILANTIALSLLMVFLYLFKY